ncbi:hypothetical protein B723_06820 [Pseudomonas fluorescens NCIMB 11764]|uniref:Uncharacterized protein n=1 Tax=Pseudomonas fluorescens NCIMB 11764 TaxID=1221522 RepID=A0A0K1QK28_PSEFL|nr:hypothetical protein B723_06820 [Pseudomonas fluorescens NCIMB 11764]
MVTEFHLLFKRGAACVLLCVVEWFLPWPSWVDVQIWEEQTSGLLLLTTTQGQLISQATRVWG